jgi:tRNA A-37 threonylcarbamoyl transferase component Bud32
MPTTPLNLAVLVSGSGTTLQNLIDQIADGQLDAKLAVVIGSRPGLLGLQRASDSKIMNFVVDRRDFADCAEFSRQMFKLCDDAGVDLVCLAGWLCLIEVPERYAGKVMNIHPALLPSFGGKGMYGQKVHQAVLGKKKFAVKIQYPGVGDSVKSDLAMIKPIALTMFKLNPVEYDEFIKEVEFRMLEETDYILELKRSMDLSEKTRHLNNIVFPKYYPQYSSSKILTMDWLEGRPLGDVTKTGVTKEVGSKLGQAMWDFYHFQMHTLKAVHADPHPGNFIITNDYKLGIIDFGCVKEIPSDFYSIYFQLMDKALLSDPKRQQKVFSDLRFIYAEDSPKEKEFFKSIFTTLVELLGRLFHAG